MATLKIDEQANNINLIQVEKTASFESTYKNATKTILMLYKNKLKNIYLYLVVHCVK